MIVVSIIGILAAIAIPNFVRFQLRTKASEGKLGLANLRSTEHSYFAEFGSFIRMAPEPQTSGPAAAPPSSSKRAWGACPTPPSMADPGHCITGYKPEGPTYYDYAVGTVNPNTGLGPGTMNIDYFSVAESDIDGDSTYNYWGIVVPRTDGLTFAPSPHVGCPDINDEFGVAGLRGSVGPCGVGFGQSVF